jgi:hypothetical protein
MNQAVFEWIQSKLPALQDGTHAGNDVMLSAIVSSGGGRARGRRPDRRRRRRGCRVWSTCRRRSGRAVRRFRPVHGERELREGHPLAVALGEPIDRDRSCHRYSSQWAGIHSVTVVVDMKMHRAHPGRGRNGLHRVPAGRRVARRRARGDARQPGSRTPDLAGGRMGRAGGRDRRGGRGRH